MAKQRGTHQIAGKINNLVYYEQKYIKGGLIRRQNEAMSTRLKEDIIFAGTRKANSLFGACMMMSGAILSVLGYRRNIIVNPSVNGLLTASVLRMYQDHNAYDKDAPINLHDFVPASFLESTDVLMKNRITRYFNSVTRIYSNVSPGSDFDIDIEARALQDFCQLSGCDRVAVSVMPCTTISPIHREIVSGKFIAPTITSSRRTAQAVWRVGDGDLSISQETLDSSEPLQLSAIVFSPIYYTQNRVDYYRTEYITAGYLWLNMTNV
jgi:hypothetical protein